MGILAGTYFEKVYTIFGLNEDDSLCYRMTLIGLVYTIVVGVYSVIQPASYGRYSSKSYSGPTMNAKLAWMIQEAPSFVAPLLLMMQTPCVNLNNTPNLIALLLFMLHYFQRSIVYPLRMTEQAKPSPVWTMLMAFLFCLYNGFLQGHHLSNVHSVPDSKLTYFGAALFLTGMGINMHHDGILVSLRKSTKKNSEGKSEYKIPRGGLFEYISGANYFGEVVEWWSLALISRGFPQLVFAIFTTAFLGIRAWHHHKFYKKTFGATYPSSRKAFIPFVF